MYRLSVADLQAAARRVGVKCLAKRYRGSSAKYLWICRCGCRWRTAYNTIEQGSGCPVCARKRVAERLRLTIEHCDAAATTCRGGVRDASLRQFMDEDEVALQEVREPMACEIE